jgi:hypothetical protein
MQHACNATGGKALPRRVEGDHVPRHDDEGTYNWYPTIEYDKLAQSARDPCMSRGDQSNPTTD